MEEEILNLSAAVVFDESIAHCETHAHQPYASSTFNNSDEVRITVQHQDLFVLPSQSAVHVQGRLLTAENGNAPPAHTTLVNNAICHLFEEIRYELNGVEIDRNKNVGLTTLMKGLVSITPHQQMTVSQNAGWRDVAESATTVLNNAAGYFDVVIPLSMLLGFAEDYNRIVVNAKHELIFTRAISDHNAIQQTQDEEYTIKINKLEWLLPYIKVSDKKKIELLNFIAKDRVISTSFRTWELYEYPLLPTTSKQIWSVKTTTQLEKPRFIILGFQTNRKNQKLVNASRFDHCNIRDVKLFLNSQCYPYANLNLDINRNQYALLYEMYANFQKMYYDKQTVEPLLTKTQFLNFAPLIVIDCSKQNESLKSGPVDVRLEFEADENFVANTSAYCLILHDRIVEYKPLSGIVNKLV